MHERFREADTFIRGTLVITARVLRARETLTWWCLTAAYFLRLPDSLRA